MPWSVEKGHGCSASKPWAVVNQRTGRREGCHATREDALKQQAALYAKEPTMGHSSLAFPVEWKAAANGEPGELEGYMSVFGNVDQGGDIVLPGAFRKTFSDWRRAKAPMPLIADHVLSTEGVIGSVTHLAEDQVGAKVRARFSSDPKAQSVRIKMLEGHLKGMSFTYEPRDFEMGVKDGERVRYLKEVRVFEATVTPFPMNELALASAKAVSNRPWSEFTESDYTPEQWRNACIIDKGVGDTNSKGRYALPVKEPSGTLNRNGVHAAAARLNQVQASADVKARAARALIRYYGELGEDPPDSLRRMAGQSSASLTWADLDETLRQAYAIPFEPARKAAVLEAISQYDADQEHAAGAVDEPPTADAAVDTDDEAKSSAADTVRADDYASRFVKYSEPRDAALSPVAALEYARDNANMERIEAQIKQALGKE